MEKIYTKFNTNYNGVVFHQQLKNKNITKATLMNHLLEKKLADGKA